jgi:hypothetical protein
LIIENIAFTLCSNNYLPQAKILGDSFLNYHPQTKFVIGLVDTYNSLVDYKCYNNMEILPVEEIGMCDLGLLSKRFNIIELNTAVKPSYFSFLFKKYSASNIIFLDPDIEVFSTFEEVFDLLKNYNIIITPQNCVPIDDSDSPSDIDLLGTGIFNLGFIALSNYERVASFLKWWHERIVKYGYANTSYNMFFDQLWINLVPAFFDNYYILKHRGYNMSPSNLHERIVSHSKNGKLTVNSDSLLRFYHFSGYRYNSPEQICHYSKRFSFETRKDIVPIYENYQIALLENNITKLSTIKPYYSNEPIILRREERSKFLQMLSRIKRASKLLIGKV